MVSHDKSERRMPRPKRPAVQIDLRSGAKPLPLERSEIEARLKELNFFLASLQNRATQFARSPRSSLLGSPLKRKDPRAPYVGSRTNAATGKRE